MSKKPTDQKNKKQNETKQPTELTNEQLGEAQGGYITSPDLQDGEARPKTAEFDPSRGTTADPNVPGSTGNSVKGKAGGG